MRKFGKFLGRGLLGLGAIGAALWAFGPYEPVDLTAGFDDRLLADGVDRYLARAEAGFDDITPGVEKRVIWAAAPETQTPLSVVYVHGFSATSEEIRPVPDHVAAALGANLVFTRLAGHGRGSDAMAEPTVNDWMQDVAEALAVGRQVGEQVVVISTSTGGTLMAQASLDGNLSRDVVAQIFVSPNFGLNSAAAPLLTLPGVRLWGPWVAGQTRDLPVRSKAQEIYWTNRYPTVALLPMAALVRHVQAQDLSAAQIPALFLFSEQDKIVDPAMTARVAAQWGGPKAVANPELGPEDDPYAHLITGAHLSPGQTGWAVQEILGWLSLQGVE